MVKKYIVRLSDEERTLLEDVVKKLKGSSQKVIRAQILLKSDANGPNWTDEKIVEAFGCRRQTVEGVRERLVTEGFETVLNGKQRCNPPRAKLLSGEINCYAAGYSTCGLWKLDVKITAKQYDRVRDSRSY